MPGAVLLFHSDLDVLACSRLLRGWVAQCIFMILMVIPRAPRSGAGLSCLFFPLSRWSSAFPVPAAGAATVFPPVPFSPALGQGFSWPLAGTLALGRAWLRHGSVLGGSLCLPLPAFGACLFLQSPASPTESLKGWHGGRR